MKTTEPHIAVGNWVKHSDNPGNNDPVSRRARIAAKARSDSSFQFTNLMHHLDQDLVEECLARIPKNSAPGIDGMTAEQARKNSNWLLPPLLNQIHQGQYKAPAVRRVYIPKADGQQRPIGVPEILDRSLQAATAQILNEIYEQDFLSCSFGFRPGRGCHNALATIHELLDKHKLNYALEVDLRDFFGSLNHEWLMKFLAHRIRDKRVLKLLETWLKAGVMERGELQSSEVGSPQGGSISPLLANIYLHYVLDLWFERKIKKQLRGKARLVRYADDFVILFENQQDIEEVKTLLEARLTHFNLSISEAKTHTTDLQPRQNGQGHDRRHMTFLGFSIFRTKNRNKTGYKIVFQTESKRFTRSKAMMKEKLWSMMHWKVEYQAERINAILRGHYNYYGLAGNGKRIQDFGHETLRYWRRCLSRRSQKGLLNWKEMSALLKKQPLTRARIRIPYSELKTYARL